MAKKKEKDIIPSNIKLLNDMKEKAGKNVEKNNTEKENNKHVNKEKNKNVNKNTENNTEKNEEVENSTINNDENDTNFATNQENEDNINTDKNEETDTKKPELAAKIAREKLTEPLKNQERTITRSYLLPEEMAREIHRLSYRYDIKKGELMKRLISIALKSIKEMEEFDV